MSTKKKLPSDWNDNDFVPGFNIKWKGRRGFACNGKIIGIVEQEKNGVVERRIEVEFRAGPDNGSPKRISVLVEKVLEISEP